MLLNADRPEVVEATEQLYSDLRAAGVDVLLDDRADRAGVKFNDMDLVGFPVRVVVGKKGLDAGAIELSLRRDGAKRSVPLADAVAAVQQILDRAARRDRAAELMATGGSSRQPSARAGSCSC